MSKRSICIVGFALAAWAVGAMGQPSLPASADANLQVHLSSTAGVTTNASGVSVWADQSGNGPHNAAAPAGNEPEWVPNQVNGKPAIQFTGANTDYLQLPTTATLGVQNSDYEIIVVARTTASGHLVSGNGTANHYDLWPNTGVTHFRAYLNSKLLTMSDDVDYCNGNVHVFMAEVFPNGFGRLRVDGVVGTAVAATISAQNLNLSLGAWWNLTARFTGDMFEVLIYDRVLTVPERTAVDAYLSNRWITPLWAEIDSSEGATYSTNSATLNATLWSTGGAPTTVWCYYGLSDGGTNVGDWAPGTSLGTVVTAPPVDFALPVEGLSDITTYHYRFMASNDYGMAWSEDTTFTTLSALPASASGNLQVRLRSDLGVTTNASGVSVWADQSGNGPHNATAPTGNEPEWVPDQVNGKPAIRFTAATPDYLQLPNTSTLGIQNSDYEIIIVAAAPLGWEHFVSGDGSGSAYDFLVASSGTFGARAILGGNVITMGAVGEYCDGKTRLFSIRVTSGDTGYIRIDGTDSAESGAGAMSAANLVLNLGTWYNQTVSFNGDMFEVLVYDRVLTAGERTAVEAYLNETWMAVPRGTLFMFR